MQGYENRGPNNERKKIYVSAVTPDLIATKYRPKLLRFYEKLFADSNAGKPLMGCYFENCYLTAPTTVDNDEQRTAMAGLARCPFPKEPFAFKDGRNGEVTNSAFGAVYGVVDGKPYPIIDTAGYAPFGFGYRRCAGEYLTVEFIKEFLRAVWNGKLTLVKLDLQTPAKIPVNPGTVLDDDIAFHKGKGT